MSHISGKFTKLSKHVWMTMLLLPWYKTNDRQKSLGKFYHSEAFAQVANAGGDVKCLEMVVQ